jgi:membrane associated rhomboid family serine protease
MSLADVVTVRVTSSRHRADEWAVVLAAAGIPHWMRHRLEGWALIVPAADADAALDSLAAYDRENAPESVAGGDQDVRARPRSIAGIVAALLLIGFFAVTGTRAGRSAWFARGGADAAAIVDGEWWRTVTALTLHADAPHLLGNAVACAVLATAVAQYLGPGVGLWLLLLAGAGGNALTAAAHGGAHVSVGASTAVFGAIGILAVLRLVAPRRRGTRGGQWWVILAASLALLALLGAGPDADLLAHLFGLLVGAALGPLAALTLRWSPPAPVQWLLTATAAATVFVAWRLAL